MPSNLTILVATASVGCAIAVAGSVAVSGQTLEAQELTFESVESLGEALFFDVNLSKNRTQSCATCHDPEHGFVDVRTTRAGQAFSLGDDGHSLGDRNAPTAAYAMFSPRFHKNKAGEYVGGQFLDGSAADLAEQAGGPPLNPIEMGMPDKASVVARLREDDDYVAALEAYFGADVFDNPDDAYLAMTKSIAAFEMTPEFAPFDSKYDRYLRGEYKMTDQEELGKLLFFSEQFTNCNLCHQLHRSPIAAQETFSDYKFYNIGVPTNVAGRAANGVPLETVDTGLMGNPKVGDLAQKGKFRTSTLRNIAVTGPYMHNGVFTDLRTVVLFYNHYNSSAKARQINPETGKNWGAPEFSETLAVKELTHGPALDDRRVDAIVAFMETLTDERYEHLLND
ncbi:MAG TPA: methylamine utilization protein MauG [Rhodobacteraceae bacterium]|nr:methylamine utilization protein MauG [Paracoccaceae bacterium]